MKMTQYQWVVGISTIFICGTTSVVFSSDPPAPDTLSPYQIFAKVQETYASLPSYSDEGKVAQDMDDTATATIFTTRLARPNLYRIEWNRSGDSSYSSGDNGLDAVWSSGAGDLVEMGWGVERQYSRDVALASAAATSGGAAGIVPHMFYNAGWRNQPDDSISGENRLADEKIGEINCYVLARELPNGESQTYWIGKEDFLIRRIRTEMSAEAMQDAWERTVQGSPEVRANFHGFTSIETHTNIVIGGVFSRMDFSPTFPLIEQPNQ